MEHFEELMVLTRDFFKIEFTLYDFTFSMWNVFLFSIVAAILAWIIGRFFGD